VFIVAYGTRGVLAHAEIFASALQASAIYLVKSVFRAFSCSIEATAI
jgi:hypothetical protein